MTGKLTRRDFVKTTGAGGIALAASGLAAPFAQERMGRRSAVGRRLGAALDRQHQGDCAGMGEVGNQLDPALRRSRIDPAEDQGLLAQSSL